MNIRKKFETTVNSSIDLIKSLPWENKSFYQSWLSQQYHLVRHTPRLLCSFALRVPLENREEFYTILHHLKEESGHDLWLVNDLEKLGTTPESNPPLPLTSAIIKSQYYQIEHDHPLSLCGYSQYLEYLSMLVAGELADRVEKSFGKNTAVFLRRHSVVDVEHSEDGWKMLEKAPQVSHSKIIENLEMTSRLYSELLIDIKNKTATHSNKKAA